MRIVEVPSPRIGIFQPEINGWVGGSKYLKVLAHCLSSACQEGGIELCILRPRTTASDQNHLPATIVPLAAPPYFRGEWRLRQLLGLRGKSSLLRSARENKISVLLPVRDVPFRAADVKLIGWIPDFQHVYLPEFFSDAECQTRDMIFRRLAQHAALVLLSSHNALEHFSAFIPEYVHKGRVFSFPSLYAYEPVKGDALLTQGKFGLPSKFALVANQFWRHKNHLGVVEALRRLHSMGSRIPVVMTGLPIENRDPTNETVSRVLQAVATAGLGDQITVLGMIPEIDLRNLMRCAAVIIQPSRFEGWSAVVQEGKALGRPVICSDIPIHREQAPDAAGFFPCDRPDFLADLLAESWDRFSPGPDLEKEAQALAVEHKFAETQGRLLLDLCLEAASRSRCKR